MGIGIQNVPEGTAVSVPLRREGVGVGKSFYYGQLSGVVEPIFAVVGAVAVIYVQPMLPFALAFAAGAMMYVVIEELIPESQHRSEERRVGKECRPRWAMHAAQQEEAIEQARHPL